MVEGKDDKSVIFWKPNTPPNWTCCMSSCNFSLSFFWTFGFVNLALHDYVLENHAMTWDTWVTVNFYGWFLCNNHQCYKYWLWYNNTWILSSLLFFAFLLLNFFFFYSLFLNKHYLNMCMLSKWWDINIHTHWLLLIFWI